MKSRLSILATVSLPGVMLFLGACAHLPAVHLAKVNVTHVPPGQSLDVALAKKPELVRLPAPAHPVAGHPTGVAGPVASVEPDLPGSDNAARVADAYSRGEFCMSTGKDDEAITAFQEAVRIDPTFTEAWQQLATLYEKKGDNKKAIEAFRRSKKIARQ